MFRFATTCVALFFVLLANAAPLASSATTYPSQLKPSTHRLKSTQDDDDDDKNSRDLNDPLLKPHHRTSSSQWAYLVAKLLAGLAVLCAIFILVFWLYRRHVRGRRRRIGEMMGLGIKRNEIVAVEREESRERDGRKKTTRFSDKDPAARRWRKEGDRSRKGKFRDEEERGGRDGDDGRSGRGGVGCARSQTF